MPQKETPEIGAPETGSMTELIARTYSRSLYVDDYAVPVALR
ncbi:hypothetical protein [Acetobacter sacchari]|nr:hypothetical protein [Acetobacter sacchari]